MRRPLVWLAVSISLMVLVASRAYSPPESESESRGEAGVQSPANAPPDESPFAYVREDGTLQFLPLANGPASAESEQGHANQFAAAAQAAAYPANPKVAVYTWSSPVSATERSVLQ